MDSLGNRVNTGAEVALMAESLIIDEIEQIELQNRALKCECLEDLKPLIRKGLCLADKEFFRQFIITHLTESHMDIIEYVIELVGVNVTDGEGNTLLHAAAAAGDEALVTWLLAKGANSNVFNNTGDSPFCIASRLNYGNIAKLLDFPERKKWSEEVRSQKILSFFMSIVAREVKGKFPNDQEFELDGIVWDEIKEDIFTLIHRLEIGSSVVNAFDYNCEELNEGKLGVIEATWGHCTAFEGGHSIRLVFYDGKLAICNRGENLQGQQTINLYKIDPKKITPEILGRIKECKKMSFDDAAFFLYYTLPELLSSEGIAEEIPVPEEVPPKTAKAGTCVVNGVKAAVKAILFLVNDSVEKAILQYKQWSTEARLALLEQHLEKIERGEIAINQDLILKSYENLKNRVEKMGYCKSEFLALKEKYARYFA